MSEAPAEKGVAHHPLDENIVDWDGPDDPKNPLNWPARKRYTHAAIVSMIALVMNLASTMYAPGAPLLMKDLSVSSSVVGSLTVSIYLLGFAFGPLVVAPLSELYGRLYIYQFCNTVYFGFTLGCALSTDIGMFLAFRFICGCAGSAPMTLGGGTIADVFPQEKRGSVMGMLAMGPIIGPVAGPVAGGFIAQNIGWRWTFWIILIMSGISSLLSIIFMRETYAPALLARKAARLSKANNNPAMRSKLDKGIPINALIKQSIVRPLKLLVLSPIVLLLSLYMSLTFGLMFLLFTTFPLVYGEKYHFSEGISGLTYLGMGVGLILGLAIFVTTSDRILKTLDAKERAANPSDTNTTEGKESIKGDNGTARFKYKPENRLFLTACLTWGLPLGFFWYGWAADKAVHWIVPILGTGLIGFGAFLVMMPVQTYLVDVFGAQAAASALAANTLLRSLFGAFLPMAGPAMYESLGLGWGNSLLGFIGLVFVPVPYFFWRYGATIRQKWPVRL